ncbi:unnamed protein product [Allacma fusca]|uniref:Uncharacterized protein n=1 Tax=Allacma fusca TaxID=39272 RepID=A0A8J2LQU2_9HEXA|nr:unnamed protein product [Allacma fusca]
MGLLVCRVATRLSRFYILTRPWWWCVDLATLPMQGIPGDVSISIAGGGTTVLESQVEIIILCPSTF